MDSSITKHQKNLSAAIHISTFSKYFIPFGNFIVPLILWTSNKNQSQFIDYNGKQALNFQISILLYSIAIGVVAFTLALFTTWDFIDFISISEYNTHHIDFDFDFDFDNPLSFSAGIILLSTMGILGLGLLVLDVVCTVIATLKSNEGIEYKYPLTINFIN
ncbi:DUF4870 domain-containing protein [Abyssalbus ytuae]|uniref:DUF4870 domain-containing protein n=1 Tax=Abyssalbus ytuae TaxID=2926907 RepID=A0A9E7A1L1_9FLAO|nr:DUF4870 domain-containing protein [Abyssalbus ytuae]UOB18051.1 DUF4870 domain-containing protein [Abyssalbus ytuae]